MFVGFTLLWVITVCLWDLCLYGWHLCVRGIYSFIVSHLCVCEIYSFMDDKCVSVGFTPLVMDLLLSGR